MLEYVDTPLGDSPGLPPARPGGWPAELEAALFPAPAEVLERLRSPGALVVTTGQQPGLFTGPLYTIHKALSARALALELEARWGRVVVPVFWVAGDDHDHAEAATARWVAADGSIETAALDPRAEDAPLTPLYREPVPAGVPGLLDRLEATLPPGPARDRTVEWLRRHYQADRSLAGASGGALAELVGDLGIACLDAAHPAAKRPATAVMRAALEATASLDARLAEEAAALEARGRSPGVKVGDGASLVFLEAAAGRDRLVPDGDGWKTRRSGERFTRSDLDRIAERSPERLSPNVLLRPVVESAVLPTVAYLAGPGELRYLDLARVLYQPLGVHRQRPTPRWSGLLVEPRVSRALDKFGADLETLLDPENDLLARMVRSRTPADFEPAFAAARAALETGLDRIAAVARQIDPTLEKPALGTKGSALAGLADLEKRLLQAEKRRQGELADKIGRMRNAVRPLGRPQERVLGIASFVGRYGFELIPELADHVTGWYRAALEAAPSPA